MAVFILFKRNVAQPVSMVFHVLLGWFAMPSRRSVDDKYSQCYFVRIQVCFNLVNSLFEYYNLSNKLFTFIGVHKCLYMVLVK
jgi:hypothetical protein